MRLSKRNPSGCMDLTPFEAINNIKNGDMMKFPINFIIPLKPRTKKNGMRILWIYRKNKKIPIIAPSEAYEEYENACGIFLKKLGIDVPVNIKALYYMPTKGRVDISNLNSALHDVLVHYGVIEDDNSNIVVSTDGSRVLYDKDNPRTEVCIVRMNDK